MWCMYGIRMCTKSRSLKIGPIVTLGTLSLLVNGAILPRVVKQFILDISSTYLLMFFPHPISFYTSIICYRKCLGRTHAHTLAHGTHSPKTREIMTSSHNSKVWNRDFKALWSQDFPCFWGVWVLCVH